MKYSKIFQEQIGCEDSKAVFMYLINNMKETIRGWDFFVAWDKVVNNVKGIEIALNILNYLIGKENIVEEFKVLVAKYPEIVEVLPILLALRVKNVRILDPVEDNIFNYKEYSFKKKISYNSHEISLLAEFVEKTGLLDMFKNKNIKSVTDYVTGIEVGLDTNARKNRSGSAMKMLVELFIKKICTRGRYRYLTQATAHNIKSSFGYHVCVDKSERAFDFAIDMGNKLYLIETNYYSRGGSKLKSVAGEFVTLYNFLKRETPQHTFIWITDGKGWQTARKPLGEAFDKIDYILNLSMLENGIFENIILERL